MPSSGESSQPKDRTCIFCVSSLAGEIFTVEPQVTELYKILKSLKTFIMKSLHSPVPEQENQNPLAQARFHRERMTN